MPLNPAEKEELLKLATAADAKPFDDASAMALIERMSASDADYFLQNREREIAHIVSDKIHGLKEKICNQFVGREELVEISLACFIAHVPMIALGPPGAAKSMVIRSIAKELGLSGSRVNSDDLRHQMQELLNNKQENNGFSLPQRRYFEYLVTRYTTPDEILGPANLSLMVNRALFFRQTSGLLAEAEVAFLDEIFKANSAILNALLSILNERIYYNAGRATKVPLCMVFGASNEPPQEEELGALFDRFPIRVLCEPVQDVQNTVAALLQKSAGHTLHEAFRENEQIEEPQAQKLTVAVNHFRFLYRLIVRRTELSLSRVSQGIQVGAQDFLPQFIETFRALHREFQISDRSCERLYRLSHALAMLRAKPLGKPEPHELDVFRYCFQDPAAANTLGSAIDDRIRRLR
jgi:MoxR-like ATPase